jgi:flagellar hook-length control protein FliK
MDVMNVLPNPNPNTATGLPKAPSGAEAGKSGKSNDVFTSVLNTVVDQQVSIEDIKDVPRNVLANNLAAMLVGVAVNTEQQNTDTVILKENLDADTENAVNPQLLAAVMALLGAQLPNAAQNVPPNTAKNVKDAVSSVDVTLDEKSSQVPFAVLQGKVLSAIQSIEASQDGLKPTQSIEAPQDGLSMTDQLPMANIQAVNATDAGGQEKAVANSVVLQNLKLVSGQVLNMPQVAAAQAENMAEMNAAKVPLAGMPDKLGKPSSQGKQAEKLSPAEKVSIDMPVISAEHTIVELPSQPVEATQAVPVTSQTDGNSIGQLLSSETTKQQSQENAAQTDTQPAFSNILAQHTDKVVHSSVHSAQQAKSGVTDFHNVAGQIVEHARLFKQPFDQNNSEMLIKLRPEHLGELSLKVAVDNGVVTASFHSNNAEVRSIIEASLPQLKQNLADQGIKVDNVDVYAGMSDFFSDSQQGELFRQQQQQKQSAKLRNLSVNEDFVEAVADTTVPQAAGADGVDYRV